MKNKIYLSLFFILGLLICFDLSAMAQYNEQSSAGEVDYSSYLQQIQSRIKRNWYPPRANKSVTPIVLFKITKNGQIVETRIQQPTSNSKIDQSVLDAVAAINPVEPPPGHKDIDIEFTFDYHAGSNRGLHTKLGNQWDYGNIAYDLTHMYTYNLFFNELKQGKFNDIVHDFGNLTLSVGFYLILFFILCRRLKILFSLRFRLPEAEVIAMPVSDSSPAKNYPNIPIAWDKFCHVDKIRLALVLLFCGMICFSGIIFSSSISASDSSYFFWCGLLMFALFSIFLFGYPRFFGQLRDITGNPGKQAVITIGKGQLNYPYSIRVERYNDGTSIAPGTLLLGELSHPDFPQPLPLTGNAEVYFDERSHEPVAVRIYGGLLFRQHSALFRRSLFLPWVK